MAQKSNRRVSSFEITNVRKGDGPHEYIITVVRDGKPVGDIKVRAPSSAPAYFNDVRGRRIPEPAA
jgi:hypothetical protein